ncbi:hypothetical protein QFC22_001390 [Naganishia vaughanmartiniae]|uniref:Uncharacterized protein n=1 Tax=Naganishia vaughanmartiniae TaxID=1424756 RepID=A0ACC2XKE8_9TREE|nr:hypothetical protein QFC22_001390 [Naganishia vaughanmartiniae]
MTSRTPVSVQGALIDTTTPTTLPHAQLIDIALQHAGASGPSSTATAEDELRQGNSDGESEPKGTGQGFLKPNQTVNSLSTTRKANFHLGRQTMQRRVPALIRSPTEVQHPLIRVPQIV